MSAKTVADVLVDVLSGAGVTRMYGVAGDSLNGITDSIAVEQLRHAGVVREKLRQLLVELQVVRDDDGHGRGHCLFDVERRECRVSRALSSTTLAIRASIQLVILHEKTAHLASAIAKNVS
jgi:hypothetical protein